MIELLTAIYTICDDFCKDFEPLWNAHLLATGTTVRLRSRSLSLAEVMTILLAFQISGHRNFKSFYRFLLQYHRREFPGLVSYTQFVGLEKSALVPLCVFSDFISGPCTGISYVDSSAIAVCKNKRIFSHKVFSGLAARGKSSMGWFFGFKFHLVINDFGQILEFKLTPGNTDDREPINKIFKDLHGKIFGDKGYISQEIFEKLFAKGIQLITSLRRKMKPKIMPLEDSVNLGKRSLVESVLNVLKNSCHLEHSRHRSVNNFMVNMVSAVCAYGLRFLDGWQSSKNTLST